MDINRIINEIEFYKSKLTFKKVFKARLICFSSLRYNKIKILFKMPKIIYKSIIDYRLYKNFNKYSIQNYVNYNEHIFTLFQVKKELQERVDFIT